MIAGAAGRRGATSGERDYAAVRRRGRQGWPRPARYGGEVVAHLLLHVAMLLLRQLFSMLRLQCLPFALPLSLRGEQ